jgi:hypothetical protein
VKIPEHGDVERSSTEVLTQKTSPRAKNREIPSQGRVGRSGETW